MNWLVYKREQRIESLDQYRRGVSLFLGNDLFREQRMGIYKNHRRVGYTAYTFEKVFPAEGVEIHSSMESRMEVDLFGSAKAIRLDGDMVLDDAMRPLRLRVEASMEGVLVTITGRRERQSFDLEVKFGLIKVFRLTLPLEELHLGNGFVPTLPLAGFKVGEVYEVPCFDPILMRRSVARVEVASKELKDIGGFKSDVYFLETDFRGMKSKSWVTAAGELVRQEFGPPLEDFVLRRESRKDARKDEKK